MKDVIGAAAGLAGFAVESARDLVQYMVRRGQMTQEEADKLIREAEEANAKRKPAATAAPPAAAPAATKSAPAAKAASPAKSASTKKAPAAKKAPATKKAPAKKKAPPKAKKKK